MNREQASLVQQASALMAVHLHNDEEGTEILLRDLATEERGPDGFVYLAILAAETWSHHTVMGRDDIWDRLAPPDPGFPPAMVDRDIAISIAKALRDGDMTALRSDRNQLDRGAAYLSAFDLALAALNLLAVATGKSAEEWCQLWAGGAAASIGVDSPD
jgi:hypothetical protein